GRLHIGVIAGAQHRNKHLGLAEFTRGEYSPKDRQKGVLVAVEQVRGREGDPELDGIVDHLCLFRDDLGAAGHASEVMAGVAVIVLNGDRSGFADDMCVFH
ncbi:MAG: hypothetical protein KDJ70_17350, partial [Candidatus Competibacteraceae bacterium]|nr:hypothetical protein [Candidatus Competibacteraceae bacterium]